MQQLIRTVKRPIHAKMNISGPKGMTLRALLMAALASGASEVTGMRIDDDTRAFINTLSQLGIMTQLDEKAASCIVAGCNGKFPKKQTTIWCSNIGTVARFLLASCSATDGVYYFDAASHLREQAIAPLLNILRQQGAQFIPSDAKKMPFTLIGADGLQGGGVVLEGAMMSCTASALLMVAAYAHAPFTLTLPHAPSHSYIEMTCAMMAELGVLVHRIHQGQWMVPVPQHYSAIDYVIEPDLAVACYFFAAAAITHGEVTIQAIKKSHVKQPYVKFLSVLENMGCQVIETRHGLTVKGPAKLRGIEISMKDFPNTFLAFVAMAPFAISPVKISHLNQAHQKNAKRLVIMRAELERLGVPIKTGEDWIEILPCSMSQGATIDPHHDHRIAMAFSVIGLKVSNIVIDEAECVTKALPEFFSLWEKLAEQVDINA